MKGNKNNNATGFSIAELMIAMVIMLVLMGVATSLFSRALGVRARESRKTDALTSAQAALNVMSREIANSGFGIYDGTLESKTASNGIIIADSDDHRIHVRSNITNTHDYSDPGVGETADAGEDVTYFFDSTTNSIVRYDPNDPVSATSVVVNKISNVTFDYFNYTAGSSVATETTSPTTTTGRVRITVTVALDPVNGQPNNQSVTFTSDVTLRNASAMLQQY